MEDLNQLYSNPDIWKPPPHLLIFKIYPYILIYTYIAQNEYKNAETWILQ